MIGIVQRYGFTLVLIAAILGVYIYYPGDDSDIRLLTGYTMGTNYRLQYVPSPGSLTSTRIADDVSGLLDRLDRGVFSTYAEQSELSRLNRSPIGQPARVSRELLEVLMLAEEISELTGGAFDVTVGPLVNLWGFGPDAGRDQVPSAGQIQNAMSRVGYQRLKINPEQASITRETEVYIDLSGIAKGYVVDQVALYFDSIGVDSYFLEIGGELKISGFKPDGNTWIPAVERPVDGAPEVFAILDSRGEQLAIAGSGDYRNFFEADGIRYSHEIDPRTGAPVLHDLAAVYVIDSQAARADALATAFMVLGYQSGLDLALRNELAVYFIVREGGDLQSHPTGEFARYIQDRETLP